MPLLSKAQFKAQRPQGDYQAYLRYVARRGGQAMSAAARAALAGSGSRPAASLSAGGSQPNQGPPKGSRATSPATSGGVRAGPGSGVSTPSLGRQFSLARAAGDEAAQLRLINSLLGSSYGSVGEATRALDLGYGFAGLEQWRRNVGGAPVSEAGDPALLNVSMESAASDEPSFQRLWNYLFDVGPARAREIVAARQALVPGWAQAAYDDVTGQGVEWNVSMLSDPAVNYRDPTKPLFAEGSHPTSLWPVSFGGAGEEGWLRSLSAEQLMREVFPTFWRSRNDPEFRAANAGNIDFGSGPNSVYRQTPGYQTYAALGHPGDPTMRGWAHGFTSSNNWGYRPLTGEGYVAPGNASGRGDLFGMLTGGQIRPEYFANPQDYWDMVRGAAGSGGMAWYTGDPSYWFRGPYEGANPAGLDPDYVKRLMALITGGEG